MPPHLSELLRRALDAAPVGIVVTDPHRADHPVLYANRAMADITGYPVAELEGRNLRLLQGPGTNRDVAAALRTAIAEGRAASAELLNYRKSGESFWMLVDIRPVRDEHGAVIAFVGTLTDVTARRRAEDLLRESEQRLRAFTSAIPLPTLTVGMDERIIDANPAAHQALAAEPGTLAGSSIDEFSSAVPRSDDPLCRALELHGFAERIEMRARRRDGQPLWILASAAPFAIHGETRFVVVFQDVTRIKEKERQLVEANEDAERDIRARSRFLAAASHDLRQPLQAMALFAAALDHHVADAQGRSVLQSLEASLRDMESMFNSLLDLSKQDAGVLRAEVRVFMLNDVFERLETSFAPQAAAAGLTLRVVPTSLAVRSDPGVLARILSNLLTNAIRYTREGTVLLGVFRRGAQARVAVVDTGPGIPDHRRLEIFREFRQLGSPAAGPGGGSGLGLAIVQRLARLLNHRIDVQSVVGRGSCFCIDIPLAEDALPAAQDGDGEEESAPVLAGRTVVVVDDDPDIQLGLRLILDDWGCRAVIAASAGEALAALDGAGARPDVILADLRLGEYGGGIGAVDAIRRHTGVEAPALLFTGDTEAPDSGAGIRVLRKPLDPRRLKAELADLLRAAAE
ncbi:PAS domain-containing protein [Magnetospirillum sp. UT-4]|uniref:PAS domain-containing protein n=1 Tax=Magnetospirillum sp. UT-4 TaxID=2681467 RepID=UPI0013847F47|nr:PAS domain-containing protein [Magnetospirillum sp. UT-4]CAA7618368.1 putative Histidine kinase [Magnetospirillum sp. UT-4]